MSIDRLVGNRVIAPSAQRSIASLLEGLSDSECERLGVDVILQNRRYLEHAQALFDRLQAGVQDQGTEQDGDHLRHDYHLALIILNGHHEVVRAVIDALGYVPIVPGKPVQDAGILDSGDPWADGRN
jgi:hypothetical protein